jgi:hypothetical protein
MTTTTATQARMWLVTRPTAKSEFCDVCWECDWTELGNCFRGGLEGSQVVGLYHSHRQAKAVAQSLLAVRDGKLDASTVAG